MDTYVVPPSGVSSITDYRTFYSGIRPSHMRGATPYVDAVHLAATIMSDKIVIGHDIKNDFDALGFKVPEKRVRDTLK